MHRIKEYLRAIRLIFLEAKHPVHTLAYLKFKHPPYEIALKTGVKIVAKDLPFVLNKLMESYLKTNFGSSDRYEYNYNGTVYCIDGFNSPATIFSTFIYQDWRRLNVKNKYVLDIGGYIGDTAIYYATRGAKKVVVFEPFPYSFKIALDNVVQNNLQDVIEINNCSVGGEDSYININPGYINTNESFAVDQLEGVKVPVITLRSIVERYQIDNWLLKMNCEGCEYEALARTDIKTLRKFSEVLMHYHGDPQPLVGKLREAGFKIRLDGLIYAKKE